MLKKLEKVLIDAISYLYYNNLTFDEYMEKNPISKKPFAHKYSFEFFNYVKFDKLETVKELVNANNLYLWDYDYFHQTCYHWAAKRGYFEMLKFLISKGNHINQYDNNKRTPLWLAALNNQYLVCQILLENKANPYMDNKEGKKPIDVTTDSHVRKLIGDYMEIYSYMSGKNFFKQQVLKKERENFLVILQDKGKQRINRKIKENMHGISRASIYINMSE